MIDSKKHLPRGYIMHPHYYIMKGKKILRLEADMCFRDLSQEVQNNLLDVDGPALNQDQANWRVVIFRDEILELDEYTQWLTTKEAQEWSEEYELDLVAN
ncbi:MAG: hypothetical protein WCY48_01995 [Candidatus Caldatribacteriota bacterium]